MTPELLLALEAIGLVIVGLLIGLALRIVAGRLLRVSGRHLPGTMGRLFGNDEGEGPASVVIGSLVFWAVFVFFLAAATQLLGVPTLVPGLIAIGGYLPRVIAAMVIVLVGLFVADIGRVAVTSAASAARLAAAHALGRMARLAILLVTTIVALDQLGIETTFIVVVVGVVLAALLGGAALAFGLGARTAVSNIVAAHYLGRTHRVGQRIRIGDVEGNIVEITPTAVLVRTSNGHAVVPAKEFGERVSVLMTDER